MASTGQQQMLSFRFICKTKCRPAQYCESGKVCLVPLVNIKIAGKWMFIPLKMVLIGIDP